MFRELYYWMYMTLRKIKTNDTPAFNASLLLCILQMANLGTVYVIGAHFLKLNNSTDRNTAIYIGLGLAGILFVLNYFLLYSRRNAIFGQYENLSQARKTKGNIYFWLYVLLSLVLFFVAVANLVTPCLPLV